MKRSLSFIYSVVVFAAFLPLNVYSQSDSLLQKASETLTDISLEELMSVTIVSASRSQENVFDAPLSSFVITRNEITNSGALNIPEALRLCPGLFVKQISNGVYDVTIRGLDNVPSHGYLNTNKLILVMINNRPVFHYMDGGTLWQNFPVDLIDVDRLEIVLGPSAPLFGPNAVTGVINIVTRLVPRTTRKDGLSISGNFQGGSSGTRMGQVFLSDRINRDWSFTGSFNYQSRERYKVDYFDKTTGKFVNSLSELSPGIITYIGIYPEKVIYPKPEIALEKTGGNLDLNYNPSKDIDLHFSGGYNKCLAWYPLSINTGMNYFPNESLYGMIKGDIKGFSVLASLLSGIQGTQGNIRPSQFDYQNIDIYLDYNLKATDRLSIRPAVHFQHAVIDDTKYKENNFWIYNARLVLNNIAVSLKADYHLQKFRFVGAVRSDKFKYPKNLYFSWQGIVNYKINEKNMVRAVFARSNNSLFIVDTYLDVLVSSTPAAPPDTPYETEVRNVGSKNRKLVSNDLYELGYRVKLEGNVQVDIALFRQAAKNFTQNVTQPPVLVDNSKLLIKSEAQNIDIRPVQYGVTFALQWALKRNFNVRPFFTLQKTQWNHYSPYFDSYEIAADKNYTVENQHNVEGKATPRLYGGFYINYLLHGKWNFNLNGTYMSRYEVYTIMSTSDRPYNEYPESKIDSKTIINAKISYQLGAHFNLFINIRNAFNADSREFFASDKVNALYLGGLNFQW